MSIIAKYKFDQTIYENFIPTFNSGFTDYTITDETDTDGFTIRTIESDSLPTTIRFGQVYVNGESGATDKSLSLLEVYECNTSNIANMDNMFRYCTNLILLDTSHFNTSKATNMGSMFQHCSSLTSLNTSNFNTSEVTNMSSMFRSCSSLTSLDVSNFNTENVTFMQNMFQNCSSLTSLDVLNFNTEKVTNMTNMFQDCSSLTHLDISSFNGSALTTGCGSMFFGCVLLQEIIFPKKFITNKCVNISTMFRNCPSLKYVDVSDWDTSSVTTINQTFNGCKSLTSLDLSSWDTTNVTSYYQAFNGCTSLQSLDISNFNILSSVTDTNTHITVCKKLVHVGMLYCNSETINIIANQIGGTRTIWYQDANLSDLTQFDNITYKKYQSTTLSLNEPIQLRSVGDIHDEINYETGEYIQRIGECIYEDDSTPTYNSQIGGYFDSMKVKGKIGLAVADGVGAISDKLINQSFTQYDFGIYGNLNGNLNIFDKTVKNEEEFINKYRGTKFQFILLEPIITKIDTTILDQNNSYKSSQQTYDEQTYVSVQSDTVVTPTSSVDYEIYSSTGTVTGTSATIENAEAGTPVSGVVYGETLLNVIQEPSEDEFVIIGDNFSGQETTIENSVAGNVKDVIIKGQTLVSLVDSVDSNEVGNYNSSPCRINLIRGLKSETVTIIFNVISLEIPNGADGIVRIGGGWTGAVRHKPILGVNKVLCNGVSNSWLGVFSNSEAYDLGQRITISDVMVLEGDYTNVDVPYFEGIGSVTNYRTIENMQPTCTYTENNGIYWCDTTTVNPTVGKQYFIKIFNNPNNAITRFFYGGVIVDTITDYGIVTATDRTGMRLHFYNLNKDTVTITEEQKNAIRFLICEYQDGMENWGINEYFEESYTVQIPVLTTVGKNLFDKTKIIFDKSIDLNTGKISDDSVTNITDFIKVIPNTQYTMSFNFTTNAWTRCFGLTEPKHGKYITDANGTNDKCYFDSDSKTITFTTSPTTNYLIFLFGKGVEESFQLEQGSTATSYEPHKSTTVTVNENIELNSIGDVYDELNVTTGELKKNVSGLETLEDTSKYTLSGNTTTDTLVVIHSIGGTSKTGDRKFISTHEIAKYGRLVEWYEGLSFRFTLPRSDSRFSDLDTFKSYIKDNPFEYIRILEEDEKSIKTVDLSIIDQDNVQQKYVQTHDTITYLKPQSYELIPTVEYKNASYDVLLKENTQYTVKLNRTNIVEGTPLTVNLGGTELSIEDSIDSFTITTPSTLTNNTLSIGGANNKVKDVMVIEGDYVDRDLDFFEGFISVENPVVSIIGKNLFDLHKFAGCCGGRVVGDEYECINPINNSVYLFDKPYINVTLSLDITQECTSGNPTSSAIAIVFEDGSIEHKPLRVSNIFNITFTSKPIIGIQMIAYCQGWKIKNIQLEKGLIKTSYEPYQGTICTTYPQATLRSVGDIKDEWDVVGETVTRRIGEVVLDGSEDWVLSAHDNSTIFYTLFNNLVHKVDYLNSMSCDKLVVHTDSESLYDSTLPNGISAYVDWSNYYPNENWLYIKHANSESSVEKFKQWLKENPITVQYELTAPITESVRITPPNPQTSTASITIPTQLDHVEDMSDFLVWNPYKEHYVRYNYVEDGVILDNYTWENLTDLNERQFVEFYNRRTYVDQPYHNYVASHDSKGTSKYVLIEPNQNYTVSVRFSELPTCETVKVNLGGAEVEMNVNDPHAHVTTPNTLVNNLCSISGDGLDGKVTDILVIHCLEHEGFADIDYFEGIDGIGEIVEVDGVPKSKIVMEQTNGNLIDEEFKIWNNGQSLRMNDNERLAVHPNTKYIVKFGRDMDKELAYTIYIQLFNKDNVQTRIINGGATQESNTREFTTNHDETMVRLYTSQLTNNGSTHRYCDMDLCCANMEKDHIRPRYYDKEEILLPIQLHRINTVYDNFYYDEMKGYYRIQQSIGHKYFVGADSENWTLIERGQRVLRFRYNNADIQMKSLGEFMTNILPNGTATSPYECCAFNGINFIVSIDKERLSSESLTAFKEWLANNNLHLYYQLASPLMIDLPEYSSRIEFNTYKDEIYTFFKNCKPTVFTLAVPLDQTYRFYELEQGEGYANRVELTDERMTEEDTLYVNTIYGSGISNLIEEPNNVDTMLKPNYEGKATSHSLTNGKVSTIGVHGFEPNNVTISNYNTVTKQYELTVQAQQGTNTNTKVLPIPYKFEVYEDGTKDKVYYNSQYKQWMFEGGQTLTVPYNTSTGAFTNAIEVFRGLQPRSGLIGEFKVRFTSGTTSVRLYYSINGTTYGYTTLRGMTDEVDYYIGFFNTGGSKIDMGTKIDANAEYTKLVPINGTIPECLMINQIQNITECTYYQDKTYYYSDVVSPLVLDVYNGTTTITELNGAVIDIQNNAHNKQALIYGDTTYTVYWTYVGGDGNIKVTLGGTTQEVVATQGYVTITTSDTDLEKGLFIGGFNVTIKDLMLVKGERITDLKYFEGSRAVGTAFTDENGETMYKITLVTGSELINDKFEETITFEDNKKHNVVVTKLLGAKPDKI